jgi:RNA polymerase sigma factor (sigma-70 family)
MIDDYLYRRNQLRKVMLLVDSRHAPTNDDKLLLEWIKAAQPDEGAIVIATKTDKLNKKEFEENLEMILIKEERKRMLHNAIKKLKPEYHQVLWLTYFEGFSNKEVALIMKKSVHNIETLVYRARRAVKDELEKEGFVYEGL